VPIYNYFQAALLLFGDGLLPEASLLLVIDAMGQNGYTVSMLANSVQDLMRRGLLQLPLVRRLEDQLQAAGMVLGQPASVFLTQFTEVVRGLEVIERPEPAWPDDIDYLRLALRTHPRRSRVHLPRFPWLTE
jgi:hypothetical protein